MSLETDLRARLLGDPSLVLLVDSRIYPDQAPQEAERPYITYERISAFRPLHFCGVTPCVQARVVYEIFAASREAARQIFDLLDTILNGLSGLVGATKLRLAHVDDETDSSEAPAGGDEEAVYVSRLDLLAWYHT